MSIVIVVVSSFDILIIHIEFVRRIIIVVREILYPTHFFIILIMGIFIRWTAHVMIIVTRMGISFFIIAIKKPIFVLEFVKFGPVRSVASISTELDFLFIMEGRIEFFILILGYRPLSFRFRCDWS